MDRYPPHNRVVGFKIAGQETASGQTAPPSPPAYVPNPMRQYVPIYDFGPQSTPSLPPLPIDGRGLPIGITPPASPVQRPASPGFSQPLYRPPARHMSPVGSRSIYPGHTSHPRTASPMGSKEPSITSPPTPAQIYERANRLPYDADALDCLDLARAIEDMAIVTQLARVILWWANCIANAQHKDIEDPHRVNRIKIVVAEAAVAFSYYAGDLRRRMEKVDNMAMAMLQWLAHSRGKAAISMESTLQPFRTLRHHSLHKQMYALSVHLHQHSQALETMYTETTGTIAFAREKLPQVSLLDELPKDISKYQKVIVDSLDRFRKLSDLQVRSARISLAETDLLLQRWTRVSESSRSLMIRLGTIGEKLFTHPYTQQLLVSTRVDGTQVYKDAFSGRPHDVPTIFKNSGLWKQGEQVFMPRLM